MVSQIMCVVYGLNFLDSKGNLAFLGLGWLKSIQKLHSLTLVSWVFKKILD